MTCYKTWEECLAAGPGKTEARAARAELDSARTGAVPHVELPPELLDLLQQKEALERELKALAGDAESDSDDRRRRQCFPVKVHTKESRIEERRLRRRDENLRMQQQRVQERKVLAQHQLRAELEAKARARRRALLLQRIERYRQSLKKASLAMLKRQAKERERLKARLDERQRLAVLERIVEKRAQRKSEEERLFSIKETLERRVREQALSDLEWAEQVDTRNRLAVARALKLAGEVRDAERQHEGRRRAALRKQYERLREQCELTRHLDGRQRRCGHG